MRVNAALQEFMFDLAGNKALPGALRRTTKPKKDDKEKLKTKPKEEDRLANGPGYNQSEKLRET